MWLADKYETKKDGEKMNNCSLFGDFEPADFGLTSTTRTRKRFPDPNYILYNNENKKKIKMEIAIANEVAKEIIGYYDSDRFFYEIDPKSGAIFLWPNKRDKSGNQLYTCQGGNYHRMSIANERDKIIDAIGEFQRIRILVVQNTNHLLIVPDVRYENNEY